MARKQKLINLHSSQLNTVPTELSLGEIAVRHNKENPELIIKVNDTEYAHFVDSGRVTTAIDSVASGLNTKVENVKSDLSVLSGNVIALSASVISFSSNTVNAINKTKEDSINAASGMLTTFSGYVVTEVNSVSASVNTIKSALDGKDAELLSNISNLSGVVSAFSASVKTELVSVENKIDKAYSSAITSAQSIAHSIAVEIYDSAVTYVNDELKGLIDDNLNGQFSALESDISIVSGMALEVSASVISLSSNTVNAINKAKEDSINAASGMLTTFSGYVVTDFKEFRSDFGDFSGHVISEFDRIDSEILAVSASAKNYIGVAVSGLTDIINNKVSVAYRYAGSCTYAELTGKTAEFVGEVWNVTDAHGNFPAGTNYAWDGEKWDALGGSVDLSPYATIDNVTKMFASAGTQISVLRSDLSYVSSYTISVSSVTTSYINTTNGKLEQLGKDITSNKEGAYSAATAYTNTVSGYIESTINAINSAQSSKNAQFSSDISGLSASTIMIQTVANSAIQSASANCGVVVEKQGTNLDFKFDTLIIDCGEF